MADRTERPGAVEGRDRLRTVVPGWPQWRRGQRSRAIALVGSYGSALGVGLFAWGSGLGAALMGFAIVVHVASVADAIRQAAFPGFGPWAPWFSATVGLGAAGYAPALAIGLQYASPAWTDGGGYLVNRVAYAERGPEAGHWIWLDRAGPDQPKTVVRVVAIGGQVVSWSEAGLRVDGLQSPVSLGTAEPDRRSAWTFAVPEGSLLVVGPDQAPGRGDRPDLSRSPGEHLTIVPANRAIGRPWVRYYPVWTRRLLA